MSYPCDRSAAFTVLLELDPAFRRQDMDTSGKTITAFLEAFRASGSLNMYEFAGQWLASARRQP